MDDAKIADEMNLDGLARRLEAIGSAVDTLQKDMTALKADMTGMTADMTGLRADMTGLRADMKTGFNESRIRDEELRDLTKFGLEAREGLRETVEARFDATDRKHDEEIGLVKDVLRAVARP